VRILKRALARPVLSIVLLPTLAFVAAGCAPLSHSSPTAAELALEREQLVEVTEGLGAARPAVARELASARALWPLISTGLPPAPSPSLRALLSTAHARASELPRPSFMAYAKRLTGPASSLAGLWEHYARLAERGSALTRAAANWISSSSPATSSYGRSSSALYIDAIYDAHFDLSLIGKYLLDAYRHLGGVHGFAAMLTPVSVDTLASAYSIPAVRLSPHPGRSIESP
jgi:hypothetical protein